METRNPYRILQVDPQADHEVIAAAYRVLARKLHPDTDPTGRDARRMADLNWAWGLLRHPESRARYDLEYRYRPAMQVATPATGGPPSHGASRPDLTDDGTGARLDFGRYAGWSLREVARHDLEYLRWLSRHASGARYRSALAVLLRQHDRQTRSAQD
jgi:curved DNA-binding protein CbpA